MRLAHADGEILEAARLKGSDAHGGAFTRPGLR
jgi:hypothetical protein